CRRCPDGTFSAAGSGSCSLCRRCEGILRYSKGCSPDGDAECTCRAGYRCGGAGCSRCERGCPAGQERARRGCQPCRYGTYNDQPDGFCKNWTKCSGNQVLEPGTPSKDVICKHASDNLNLVSEITAD
ncbi:TNR9 factor, partial [Piaya cayana]|nr:TNR9 factor [Piaya cayana]